jgi:hypothetical protein
LFNKVKPHVLEAHEYVVNRYQELTKSWISLPALNGRLRDSPPSFFALNYGQLQKVWTHY